MKFNISATAVWRIFQVKSQQTHKTSCALLSTILNARRQEDTHYKSRGGGEQKGGLKQ